MTEFEHKGSLTPAYGRHYASMELAECDWYSGKDFKFHSIHRLSGRYCSCRDFKKTDKLQLHINGRVTIVHGIQ